MLRPVHEPTSASRAATRRTLGLGVALTVAVIIAYALALRGGFLWDDDLHVTANPTIIGPLGLKEIWTTAAANYFPLVLTNFWVQHALWGLNPLGYHAVTIAFHAIAAVLLWRVLLQLRVPGAWLGAALWALHPVQVESVAWIAELKNTQSAVFFLLAIWFWLKWQRLPAAESEESAAGSRSHYLLALACALLALLSKPSTVMLPVVLGLCGWWRRGRISRRDGVWLAPFFALSAVASGWAIWEQKFHSGALGAEWSQSTPERLAIAGRVVWFYLGKLFWPHPLTFIYPRWAIDAARPLAYVPAAAAIAALFLLWRQRHGRLRPVFVAAVYFGALLFPVLGFFNVYFFRYSYVGDHFQYLASMGPLALAGAVIAAASKWHGRSLLGGDGMEWHRLPAGDSCGWKPQSPHRLPLDKPVRRAQGPELVEGLGALSLPNGPAGSYNWLGLAGAGLLLLGLGVMTFRQCRVYAGNESLWRATVTDNPDTVMAWLNLGDTLGRQGRHHEAIACFTRATRMKPGDPDGWNDLGCELVLAGSPAAAVPPLERAIQLNPAKPESYNNLGNALRKIGRANEAMALYQRALALRPAYAEAHNNLGAELAEAGRPGEAVPHFEAALRVKPDDAETHDNFGNALRALGRWPEAVAEHEAALRLKPDSAAIHNHFGLTLAAGGRHAEAIAHYEAALRLRPEFAAARGNLGRTLAALGRTDEAFAQFERAVQLTPDSAEAHNNLGSALAQAGRLDEARAHFEAAARLAPTSAETRVNLGVAFSQAGRWRDAIAQFEQAVQLRPDLADAHARLGVALVNADRLEQAVPVFEQALRLNPNAAEVHNNFGQVLRALGRNREALEHLEEAARLQREATRR